MQSQQEKELLIKEIVAGILDFKIIPFFGSGMSIRFGLKDWGQLIKVLKSELATATTNYQEVAQEYEDRFGRAALIDRIRSETGDVEFDEANLSAHYQILTMAPPLIYTTNWDAAIETAATRLNSNYKKIASLADIVNAPHNAGLIVKFHGDFSCPDNIVFTKNDYEKRLRVQHPFDVLFRAHILGKSVLFLGYSFSDENIDFIFSTHRELYGSGELPKSYLIAFSYNKDKIEALANKNITTLVLDSPEELEVLIRSVNQTVFEQDIDRQVDALFQERPQQALVLHDIENLEHMIHNATIGDEQKGEKLRQTVDLKAMSEGAEEKLVELLSRIVTSDVGLPIKEAILLSFPHLQLQKPKNALTLSIELVSLTKYDQFNLSLTNYTFTDVISLIESRIGTELTCAVIFLFLTGAVENKESLAEPQLTRLFEALRDYDYSAHERLYELVPQEQQRELLKHFSQRFPSLQRLLEYESPFGRRPTRGQISKQMKKMLGKNLGDI